MEVPIVMWLLSSAFLGGWFARGAVIAYRNMRNEERERNEKLENAPVADKKTENADTVSR